MPSEFFNLRHPQAFQWLWALVPLVALFAWDLRRRRRVLQLFVSRSLLDDVSPRRSLARPIARFGVLAAGLAVLVVALAQPRWDPEEVEVQEQGRNLLFCLDVSNSMRARDADPSRLDAAKAAVRQLVNALPAGDQVGLLVYAGSSVVKCPLTPNFTHFLTVLDRVSYDSATMGGTNLGFAIHRAVTEVFGRPPATTIVGTTTRPAVGETVAEAETTEEAPAVHDHLIVITDGESHEGHAKAMAENAARNNIGVLIIGVGSAEGATIPIERNGKEAPLRYKGQDVITRLDSKSLAAVVPQTGAGGAYMDAGTRVIDLRGVYASHIVPQGTRTAEHRQTIWQEKFQLFAGLGLVLLVISSLISEQQPAPREEPSA